MHTSKLLLPVLAAFAAVTLSAQRAPVAPPTPVTTTPRTAPAPTTPSGNAPVDNSFPIYIAGKVVTNDGSELPQNVTIVRVCSNVKRTLGFVDSKGHFSFRVNNGGPSLGVIGDASESGRNDSSGSGAFGNDPFGGGSSRSGASAQNPLLGCELEVYAPGFRSPTIDLSSRRAMDNSDLGTVVIHRIAGIEGTSVSATSYTAPKEAQKAFQKGEQFMQKAKPELALKEFEKATSLYPKYAAAWLDLGRAQTHLKDDAAAGDAFRKAIDADPKLVDSWGELGMVQLRQKNWAEASQNLDRALHLNPVEFPHLWFFDAVANFNAHNYEAAEKSAREARRVDPNHANPRSDQILGLILYQKKDLPGAVDALRSYLKYAKEAPDAAQVQSQIGELESALAANQSVSP